MFIAGTGLFGVCDHVGNRCWVATRFLTIFFIPLVPLQGFLVFEDSGTSFRGIQIPMDFKSVLLAWLRAALWVPGLGATGFGLYSVFLAVTDGRPSLPEALAPLGAGALLFFLAFKSIGLGFRAGYERALELGKVAGIDPGWIAFQYGKVPGVLPGHLAPAAAAPLPPTDPPARPKS